MSCGGAITLHRGDHGYEIRINWLTGGIEIVARAHLEHVGGGSGFTIIEVLIALAVIAVCLAAIGHRGWRHSRA